MGNALVCIPAVRALRKAWPKAYMAMVADPFTRQVLEHCPYIDEFIEYDNRRAQKAGPGYIQFIYQLRKRKPTHVIHFRRYLRSELMGLLSGAPLRVGFKTEAKLQLINRKVPYIEGKNIIELNLDLVRALGVESQNRQLEYWTPEDTSLVDALYRGLDTQAGPVVVIHPAGSTQKHRLWPYYGEIADRVRAELQARVVFIGAKGELPVIEEALRSMRTNAKTAIGWPVPQVAELIKRARVFLGTDSGPCHLADAVGTPGVILYAPHRNLSRQLAKWKPEGPAYKAMLPEKDCTECELFPCTIENQKQCAASIPQDAVMDAVKQLLEEQGGQNGGNPGNVDR